MEAERGEGEEEGTEVRGQETAENEERDEELLLFPAGPGCGHHGPEDPAVFSSAPSQSLTRLPSDFSACCFVFLHMVLHVFHLMVI